MMYRTNNVTYVTFLIFVIILNTIIVVNAKSSSSSSSSLYNNGRTLNSKIASLIKQSSITINSYGTVGNVGNVGTNCNPENVHSILSRVHRGGGGRGGGATETISRTVRNKSSSSSGVRDLRGGSMSVNQTATVMKSHPYDNEFSSSSLSSSSNSTDTVEITTSVSSTATSMNNTQSIASEIALENNNESGDASQTTMEEKQIDEKKKLKVLFLSADTGGGHRASAQSLASQFLKHYPGIEYELLDIWTPTNVYPYKHLVNSYKHLSAHPRQWKLLYYLSNTKWYEKLADVHSHMKCRKKIESYIEETNPDIVISVHPTMNFVPERAVRNIATKQGRYIPFFTVVTDFGSAHCTWFQKNVDMIYVASQRILKLAKRRGSLKDDKIVMSGLPIREDFAIQAEKMGDRTTEHGKEYRKEMKSTLGLNSDKKMILLMGGGEGVGSLSQIAGVLRTQLRNQGVDATICVVCGRNEKLKNELNNKDWDAEEAKSKNKKRRRRKKKQEEVAQALDSKVGDVEVIGLGFITNMADYMVAADVLVSKAGPGTIAEAAALGLPVMITSFLPGQEAGNVNIVLDGGFGAFHKKPQKIASTISEWIQDEMKLDEMSRNSMNVGNPTAASDIVQDIYKISMDMMSSTMMMNQNGVVNSSA